MSQTTKKALAASLKKLLLQKPLDKITVVDIADDCGINRQTFYYHFQDIHDLVEWIFLSEAAKALGGNTTYDTWQEGLSRIFEYICENKPLIRNTYHSVSREHLERYLYREIYNLLYGFVAENAAGRAVRDEDKAFVAHFYKFAFAGVVLEWIRTGMKQQPEDIIKKLGILMQGAVPGALERFEDIV